MILMALDHVRDFFGVPGVSPTNLAQTTVPLFLTRWITHICAPTFFLLTGTGAFLSLGRKSIPGAVAIPVIAWRVADCTGTDGWWVAIVIALSPSCRWFAAVKRRRTDAWLSYL